ncbi:hypothetical protein ACWD7T_28970 [Streptomyces sp. 900116325]
MSSFNLDQREKAKEFAAYFKQLEDRLAALERSNQLNYASIEGGSLDIYDEEGTLKGSVGVQPDGGVALVPVNTEPPPTPTPPVVEPKLAGLTVGWDGAWADSTEAPSDFGLIQVHLGTTETFEPDVITQAGTITAPLGGTVTVGTEGYTSVWVRLVAANTAAITGEPSTAVEGKPRQAVSEDLIDGIVTEVKLAENAVTEAKIALEAVTGDKVKPGAINDLLLADDAVTAAKLAVGAVNATALADGAVLAEKLAANAVTQGKLANGAVTELALANQAVSAAKVAALAIDSTKLADAAVIAAKIGLAAVTSTALATGAVTAAKIDAGAVTTAKLAAGAVTANEIAANTITAGQLAANSVTAFQLTAGSVLTAALAADAVAAGKIAADAITARELAANSVTALELSAGSVTAQAVAAGAVTAEKMTVVGGSNVLADPSFEGPAGAAIAAKQTFLSIDKAFGNGSPSSLKIDAVSATAVYRAGELTLLPVTAGDQIFVAADYYPSTGWVGAEIDLQVRWEKADGTILSYGKLSTTTPVKGAWARFSGTVTAPTDAVLGRVRVESGAATAGAVWWDNAAVRPVVPGVQIADGAITTPKMIAGSIQGDRIAVNTLAADRIVSGSITTSQLTVTTAASVLQKFYDVGADAPRWRTGGSSTTTATTPANLTSVQVPDAQAGGTVMRAVGGVVSAWRPDQLIPFDPNVLYRISATVRQTVAGSDTSQQRFYMGVAGVATDGITLVNAAGAASGSNQHYVAANSQNLTAGGGWQRFTGYLKGYAAGGANGTGTPAPSPTAPGVLHANARYISPLFYVNYLAGTGTAEISMVTVEVIETGAVQTVNIGDGAITAPKILAGAVTTDKLVALSVTAEKIASLAITTDKLAALSITADKMAVNSVTATAIAAGAIDATHIKADAINGKTITGATIQTAATGPRIVMDSTALAVRDAGNNLVAAIDPDDGTGRSSFTTYDTRLGLEYYSALTAGDLRFGIGGVTDESTEAFISYSSLGSHLYELLLSSGHDAGIASAEINLYSADAVGSGNSSINLAADKVTVPGVLTQGNVKTGRTSITPSAVGTPTSITVTGLGLVGTSPRAVATASSVAPGTQVAGVGTTSVTTSSFVLWLTKNVNTSAVPIDWIVMAGEN